MDLPRISSGTLKHIEGERCDETAPATESSNAEERSNTGKLSAIKEGEEELAKAAPLENEPSSFLQTLESAEDTTVHSDSDDEERKQEIGSEEVNALKRFLCRDNASPDHVTVSNCARDLYKNALVSFSKVLNSSMTLDVESESKDLFGKSFLEFSMQFSEFEKFLCTYLNVIFLRKQPVFKAIAILNKFQPLEGRESMQEALAEKYVDAFIWFQPELRNIQEIYEEGKNNPPIARDAPPTGGVVEWCRMLLSRIEEPMRVFRVQPAINSLRDFARVSRIYNALATPLVAYEQMCLQKWRRDVNGVTDSFRLTLLYQDPESGHLIVNADPRIREHIAESRYLQRLGIELPKAAVQLLTYEQTFKRCYNKLTHAIKHLTTSVNKLQPHYRPIFAPHHRRVMTVLHPGLSTLAWNSVNIEAYLHSAETATFGFQHAVDSFLRNLESQVSQKIKDLYKHTLLDFDCFPNPKNVSLQEFCSLAHDSVSSRSSMLSLRLGEIRENVWLLISKAYMGEKSLNATMMSDTSSRKGTTDPDKVQIDHFVGVVMDDLMPSINHAIETILRRSLSHLDHILAFTPYVTVEQELPEASKISANQTPVECLEDFAEQVESISWEQLTSLCIPGPISIHIVVDYSLPRIRIEPNQIEVHKAGEVIANQICSFEKDRRNTALVNINVGADLMLREFLSQQDTKYNNCRHVFDTVLRAISQYDWMWDDSSTVHLAERSQSPSAAQVDSCLALVHRIEDAIQSIPKHIFHATYAIDLDSIINSLTAVIRQWKFAFSQKLHQRALEALNKEWNYMDSVEQRLKNPADKLEDLSAIIMLFEETDNVHLKSDKLFSEIETYYQRIE